MNKNSILEVNLSNFKHNYSEIKKLLNEKTEIMPIFKDNAYKTYINSQISLLDELNINIIGVSKVCEGITMRELGFNKEIFILNQPFENEIDKIARYNLTIGCGSIKYVKKLKEFPYNFNVHIEVCTGMGRTGILPSNLFEYINELKQSSNINVTGIYTHFACSDSDEEYTKKQLTIFNDSLNNIKKDFSTLKYIHACNSAGIINFPDAHFNLVRPGLMLYGHYPTDKSTSKTNLKPVTNLKSKI